ncbi:MAG TPA: alpha/beta fold hydrolase [Longimicrobiaceae bacterium]|nr:alpha/beta fold hydrolase [Longimicrobiaceae bacterium]
MKDKKSVLGAASKAALGLGAAAAAAYGVYLLGGATRARRRPVTELAKSLDLRIAYTNWRGVHYAYYVRRGQGVPLVFLHSIDAVASAHEMRPLVRQLQLETDRPVYALEWLGFGHSDRPEISYTPELLEDQLEHFLEKIVRAPAGADVIGLSLGATYAADVARRRPDLVHSLVAIEPAGFGEEPSPIAEVWARLLFTLPGVQRAFYDRLTTPDALREFAAENLFTDAYGVPEDFVRYGYETARVEGASRPLDDFLSGRLFPDSGEESFRRLRQPLLVIHGTVQDRRMEQYTELPEIEARPGARVVAIEAGSMPHWERTDAVVREIRDFYRQIAERETPPTTEPAAADALGTAAAAADPAPVTESGAVTDA